MLSNIFLSAMPVKNREPLFPEKILELFCGKGLFERLHQNTMTRFDEEKEFLL